MSISSHAMSNTVSFHLFYDQKREKEDARKQERLSKQVSSFQARVYI